jgi:hypothetical protein
MTSKAIRKIDEMNRKRWLLGASRDRENGQAIIYLEGSKGWVTNDKYHRIDGPAFEDVNGSKYWIQNGVYHREDGPAITLPDDDEGSPYWYINGRRLYPEKSIKNKKLKQKYPKLIKAMKIYLAIQSVHNS